MTVPAPRIPAYKVTSRYRAPRPKAKPAVRPPIHTPTRVFGPPIPRPQTAQQWADAQAQRLVDAQIQAIHDQQSQYNQTLLDEAARQTAQAQKFAQMVQGLGIPDQIRGIYGSAGRDIAGMAGGFAGDIRNIAAADAAAQTNMLSGTGQEGAVRNEGTGMGDVVYGVGGYIPGKTMGEQGAAFAADAARQPGFILEDRLGKAQDAYNEALKSSNSDFLSSIMKVNTGKQGVASDLYDQRVKQSMAEQKMRLAQFNQDRNYWLKMQAYYRAIGKDKLSQDAARRAAQAEQRYANESMGRDAAGNIAPGYMQLPNGIVIKRSEYRQQQKDKGLDVNGNLLPGYARKGGRIVKVSTAKPKGAASLSPSKQADIMTTVLHKESDITKTDLPQLAKQTGYAALLKQPNASPKEKARLQKSIARALWVRYAPIAMTPASKRALRNMIARLVKSYSPSAGSALTANLGLTP